MSDESYFNSYRRYIQKFDAEIGEREFGEMARYQGYLIKKLKFDEYVEKYKEFVEIEELLERTQRDGATTNDEVFRMYLELAASVLELPKDYTRV